MSFLRRAADSLLRVAFLLFGVYVTYLVVMNVLIVSGGLRAVLNRLSPVHAHFDWSSAYSPWFMRVHTKDFVFRGEDSSVQWEMKFDRANATFAVHDFFAKRVHMSNAQASGVQIRVRFKVDAAELTPALLEKLPPMPQGLAALPTKPAILPPEPTDENYALWTVELDDVVATHVREVWFDSVRFTDADGSMRGGFFLKPLRQAWVAPTTYDATAGNVAIGKSTVLRDLHGAVTVHVRTFDVRFPEGLGTLAKVDASVDLDGGTDDLHAIAAPFFGGRGPFQTSIALKEGRVLPGSRVHWRSNGWTVVEEKMKASGTSLVDVRVDSESIARATIETWGGSFVHEKAVVAEIPFLAVALRSPDTNLTKAPEHWSAVVDLPNAHVPRLVALNAVFGSRLFDDGSARVAGHVELDEHVARNVRVDLRDVAIGAQKGWWATFTATPVTYALRGTPAFGATLIGKLRDAQVPLELLGAPGIARAFIGAQSFAVKTIFRVVGPTMSFSDVRLIGDRIDVFAHVHKDARGANGAMIFETKLANVGLDIHDGSSTVHPLASHAWYEQTTRRTRAAK